MATYDFDYARATSVEEALSLKAEHGSGATFLAGGHSLIPVMKQRLSQPSMLIDISEMAELTGVEERDGYLYVGALTTHYGVEFSDVAKEKCPVLHRLAAQIGDPQVRNRGTIGGSLAHADPAADYPSVVLALGCNIELRNAQGETRTVAADDFFTGMFETAVQDDEMITRVIFPTFGPGRGASYAKFANPASRYAIAGVAAIVEMDGGTCEWVRVAVTGAVPSAMRATAVEDALTGTSLSDDDIDDAVSGAFDASDMMEDLSGSKEYRAHLCEVQAAQALREARDEA